MKNSLRFALLLIGLLVSTLSFSFAVGSSPPVTESLSKIKIEKAVVFTVNTAVAVKAQADSLLACTAMLATEAVKSYNIAITAGKLVSESELEKGRKPPFQRFYEQAQNTTLNLSLTFYRIAPEAPRIPSLNLNVTNSNI